jgi:hypothetical protein
MCAQDFSSPATYALIPPGTSFFRTCAQDSNETNHLRAKSAWNFLFSYARSGRQQNEQSSRLFRLRIPFFLGAFFLVRELRFCCLVRGSEETAFLNARFTKRHRQRRGSVPGTEEFNRSAWKICRKTIRPYTRVINKRREYFTTNSSNPT